ncbi:HD domain-containing phosphohydrolase [Geotalea sp. SG265]|uniref:GAF and HD-GYP domain-containing protein n=1 Tax=Geotalea sp. SG265 TaxID=2922867 RepID=UPI001FAE892E|nr:HD domain-containing phosphohydrolase [Geotalea sp. SG265]
MIDMSKKLQRIIDLGLEISRINDIDLLLEKILLEARRFTRADAGSIYIREDDRLHFSYTQNDTLQRNLPPSRKLIYSTFSIPIDHHSIAGHVAASGEAINIADVYRLNRDDPFSFDRSYDDIAGYRTRSMLTFPLKTVRGEVTGVLQLINAKDGAGEPVPFAAEDEPLLVHFANNAANAVERAKLTRGIIMRMNKMAELRDPKETGPHVKRVGAYSSAIYETWAAKRNIPPAEIERNKDILTMAAMLHDVGKVAISDIIMKKPGRFTPEEYDIMKQHTVLGARLFAELYSDVDEAAYVVALNHHERWDGRGYPGHVDRETGLPLPGHVDENGAHLGKKGEEIPLFGRIVAIADVYDALCSQRCYKEAWSEEEVLDNLRSESGKQFDPEVVEAFFETLDTIRHITSIYPHD